MAVTEYEVWSPRSSLKGPVNAKTSLLIRLAKIGYGSDKDCVKCTTLGLTLSYAHKYRSWDKDGSVLI
jgi:hypothetical protein